MTVIKGVRIYPRRQYANISAPIRPSAVRNSNKNLLLSGVFLPSRALAFSDSYKKGFVYILGGDLTICILLSACRRRKAKFATPCAMQGVCIQACGSSSPQIVLSFASLRLLLPTNRALFRPAKILSAETSRCADLWGPLKQHHPKIFCSRACFYPLGRLLFMTVIKRVRIYPRRRYANIPAPIRPSAVRNSNKNLLLSGALYPFLTERCVAGAREGRVFFCRKRCLYCQNRGISYRFGVERQYDDYLCACRDGVCQGGERERSFLRHGDGHSVCGHE